MKELSRYGMACWVYLCIGLMNAGFGYLRENGYWWLANVASLGDPCLQSGNRLEVLLHKMEITLMQGGKFEQVRRPKKAKTIFALYPASIEKWLANWSK